MAARLLLYISIVTVLDAPAIKVYLTCCQPSDARGAVALPLASVIFVALLKETPILALDGSLETDFIQ